MLEDKNIIQTENEDIEIQVFLEAIFLKYGYDFRGYSKAHIKRRVLRRLNISGFSSISEMQHKLLYDRSFFEVIISDFSINVTEMFRDPSFYKKLREEVVPVLKTYPSIKTWHAGCATGEEVYSMAILFKEEGLYDQSQIYATDFNKKVLGKAKEGVYTIDDIRRYTYNYQYSGGLASFAEYYDASNDSVKIDQTLKKNIVFADHNLTVDGVFGEMDMVVCRNVLIYFTRELQDKVIKLLYDSLSYKGYLCLGSKETLRFSTLADKFEIIDEKEKIFRKKHEIKE